MKKLLLILAVFAAAHANASSTPTADLSKLTPAQQAEVLANIEKMAKPEEKAKNISETARHETEKWAELGGNMGKAAVGAAKEIGMAANEFIATPLGKVTMGVVIYKVIGKDIIKFIVGGAILVFFFSMAVYLVRSKKYTGSVEYEYKPAFFGLRQKQVVKSGVIDSDWAVGYMVAALACVIMGMVVGLSVMP